MLPTSRCLVNCVGSRTVLQRFVAQDDVAAIGALRELGTAHDDPDRFKVAAFLKVKSNRLSVLTFPPLLGRFVWLAG